MCPETKTRRNGNVSVSENHVRNGKQLSPGLAIHVASRSRTKPKHHVSRSHASNVHHVISLRAPRRRVKHRPGRRQGPRQTITHFIDQKIRPLACVSDLNEGLKRGIGPRV